MLYWFFHRARQLARPDRRTASAPSRTRCGLQIRATAAFPWRQILAVKVLAAKLLLRPIARDALSVRRADGAPRAGLHCRAWPAPPRSSTLRSSGHRLLTEREMDAGLFRHEPARSARDRRSGEWSQLSRLRQRAEKRVEQFIAQTTVEASAPRSPTARTAVGPLLPR
jgi:hypothetical protein